MCCICLVLFLYPRVNRERYKSSIFILYWLTDWFIVFSATFSNISAISWRQVLGVEEAPTMGKQLVNLRLRVDCNLFVIYKAGREPTP